MYIYILYIYEFSLGLDMVCRRESKIGDLEAEIPCTYTYSLVSYC